jgi:transcriptional regulator with XRE-family HTH domain
MLGERIRERRKALKLTAEGLAEKLGVIRNTVYRWESGDRIPSDDDKRKIAKTLETSQAYLLGETDDLRPLVVYKNLHDEGELLSEGGVSAPDYDIIKLPVLSMASVVCAEDGFSLEYVEDEIDDFEYISRSDIGVIDQDNKPFIVRVEGDSMEGAGVPDGARVVINPALEVRDGNPALVCYGINHMRAVKWVYWPPKGGVEIRSADPKYAPRTFTDEERELGFFFVIGKVIKIITEPLNG